MKVIQRSDELRILKHVAHKAFDALWKNGGMSRTQAYEWLAWQMGVSLGNAHIRLFNERQCREVIYRVSYYQQCCRRV